MVSLFSTMFKLYLDKGNHLKLIFTKNKTQQPLNGYKLIQEMRENMTNKLVKASS